MTKTSDTTSSVIEHLYDVAVDPTSYERLLDFWADMMRLPEGADGQADGVEAALAQLSGHLERADRVLAQSMMAPPDESAASAVGAVHHAATFAINKSGTLISVNAPAALALGITNGARAADLPFEPGEVDRLMAETNRILKGNARATTVMCLRARDTERLIVAHMRLYRPLSDEPFVLCVTSEISWPAGFTAQMQQSFGLSLTEIDLLRHLAEGHSVNDIADLRARSRETVRVQIKSLLAKTGTRSQLELVRLALTTVEALFAADDGFTADALPQSALEPHSFLLKDGRNFDYVIQGDPNGRPVFFLPMDFGFIRLPPAIEAEARRRRLKFIVPIRPGYGRSSPIPAEADYLGRLCNDLLDLLDHLKVQRAPILSMGDDSLIALALYAVAPHRFPALLCCAGTMPISARAQHDRMGKWHRFIHSACVYTPQMLPFVVKAGAAMARRVGKKRFFESIYAGSPADIATFSLPDVRDALISGSDIMLSENFSGHETFARELTAKVVVDWETPLRMMEAAATSGTLKVQFYNGEQDPQIPPKTLAEFAEEYSWISFRTYPDAGQLVFYLKWRDVLTDLEAVV
ncbi:MAG: hypothetical protein GX970_13455 [Phyllobacteriaceae bacterium]|nr:hypothetical protein [Phyllobacteriaceae bacterium]